MCSHVAVALVCLGDRKRSYPPRFERPLLSDDSFARRVLPLLWRVGKFRRSNVFGEAIP